MKNLLSILPLTALLIGTTATAAPNVFSDANSVVEDNITFPDVSKSYLHDFPRYDSDDLIHINNGIDDDTVRQLIGNPHFSEFMSNKWNYVLKIRQPYTKQYIQCQLQLHFDDHDVVERHYWDKQECADAVQPQPKLQPQPQPIVTVAPAPERINLSADALFAFDKWKTEDILSQGRAELDNLAQKLREYQDIGDMRIVITGHTDRKGDDMYNMNLSQLRAQTVRSYLASRGINPNTILAIGAGETQPVQQCSTSLPREQEINCLQPNRRVTLDVTLIKD